MDSQNESKGEIPIIPGIFKVIYDDILENSPIPRHSTAYSATLAIMGSAIGRTASIQSTMPNFIQFIVMPTESGKNIVRQSIQRVLKSVGLSKVLGSNHLTSETSLISEFETRNLYPEITSICDEGHEVLKHCTKFGAENALKKMGSMKFGELMDSRRIVSFQGVRASKNIGQDVISPFYNFIAITTPENFKLHLPKDAVSSGFLNRLLIWYDNRIVNVSIPKKDYDFNNSTVALNKLSKVCLYDYRVEQIEASSQKKNKEEATLSMAEDVHHKLIMSDTAKMYFKTQVDIHMEKFNKRRRIYLPTVGMGRFIERVCPVLTIIHASIYAERFHEAPISIKEIDMAISIIEALRTKNINDREKIKEGEMDHDYIQKLIDKISRTYQSRNVKEMSVRDFVNYTRTRTMPMSKEKIEFLAEKGLLKINSKGMIEQVD